MGIPVNSGFTVGAPLPIDERIVLTKEQMRTINENTMPEVYFAACVDDGALYVFNKSNPSTEETGKFTPVGDGGTSIQTRTMPVAGASYEGAVLQYVGEPTDEYAKGVFYECKCDDAGEYCWESVQTQVCESILDEAFTTGDEFGGIPAGTTFEAGTTTNDIIKQLLTKYSAPEATITIEPDATVYAVGETVSGLVLSVEAVKKTNPITEIKFYNGDTEINTVAEDVSNGGTFTYTVADAITDDTTFKVTVSDGTETVTSEVAIDFVTPYYYGVSSTNGITDATGFTSMVEIKEDETVIYNAENEYLVFMSPAEYGELTSIRDYNGFDNFGSFTKSTVDISGTSYNVYVSNYPITCTDYGYTFK